MAGFFAIGERQRPVSGYLQQDRKCTGVAGHSGRAVSRYTVVTTAWEAGVFGPPFSCAHVVTTHIVLCTICGMRCCQVTKGWFLLKKTDAPLTVV